MNSKADLTPGRHKRLKTCTDGKYHDIGMDFSASKSDEITPQKPVRTHSNAVDFSSPFFILDGLESGKFGSVAKDIQALLDRKMQSPNLYSKSFPSPENGFLDVGKDELKPASKFMNRKTTRSEGDIVIIDLEDEFPANETQTTSIPVMIIDSDGEDMGDQTDEKPSLTSRNVLTDHPAGETLLKDVKEDKHVHVDIKDERNHLHDTEVGDSVDACVVDLTQIEEDECVHDEPPREISFKDVEEDKQVHVDKEDEDNQLPISEDGDFKDPCVEVLTEIKEDEPVCDQPAGETLLKDIEEDKDGHVGIEDKGSRPPNTEDGDLGDVCVEDDTEIKEDGFLYDQPSGETLLKDIEENKEVHVGIQDEDNLLTHSEDGGLEDVCGEDATEIQEDGCVHVGTEDEGNESSNEDDGLEHCWREMSMALELSKDVSEYRSGNKQVVEESEDEDKCPHSFILKDDLGYVCRICGVIDKGIETIFEFQYSKVKRSSRTYMRGLWNSKDGESTGIGGLNLSSDNLSLNEVYAHPRHANKMKPHQVEGFNFLVSNLVGDNPGGCILAHAPGSGKTFMVISFLQSFMVKYPNARPLVVLPKGILDTWKKEFRIWQIEDIPLYDLQMDNRFQQLAVLKQWVENRSILFLGYQKFSSIVCDTESSDITNSCREILLKAPSILFLDEGHTPRNDSTDIFQALAMVQTPRKVILSGTLYQNKVKEVFTLLNLVRPGFLGTETSQPIIQRIMSKVDMSFSTVRKNFKACSDVAFYDVVEGTLQKDKDFRRKVSVINDLREMTSKVLHYYKGDFLDELPGLVDFTVVLHLSSSQKREVEKIKLQNKFKAISVGASVYLHPKLRSLSDNPNAIDDEIDEVLEKIVVEDGAKAKFFCNVLSLCESKDEKLLVFSQYITPLKFLERLLEKEKGWCRGREIFLVSGDSHQNDRKLSMECFNNSPKARVFFGSIKACGEGISLVGASRVIILDVHLNPSVTRQAIGRAFRPGQTKKVVVYRLVAADSPEVEDYETCFRKELISKLWFEWKEYCGYRDFEVETVDVNECGDEFLESNPILAKDVKVLYRR